MSGTKKYYKKRTPKIKKNDYYKRTPLYASRDYYRRRRLALKGRGDYSDWNESDTRILGNKGSFKAYGGYYGRKLGELAGSAISTLTGFGDYVQPGFRVNTNSMLSGAGGNDPPSIVNTKGENTIIRHREFIKDIVTSPTAGAFQNEDFVINPANSTLFPWLSRVCAESWQQYRLRGMVFEFKSVAADAIATSGTNNSIGTIVMATNYNASEPAWISKNQMENTEFASSAKQCHSMLHPIECAKSQTPLSEMYIGVPSADEDEKMYNWGRFQIASVGNQAASVNIGELWVSYEIELLKPFVSNEPSDSQNITVHYYASTGATASSWFSPAPVRQLGSNMPITVAGNNINFNDTPTGLYLITIQHLNTGTAQLWAPPNAGYTRCELVQLFEGGTSGRAYAPVTGNGGGRSTLSYIVRTTGPNAIFSITGGTCIGSTASVDVFVSAMDPNIQ